jgi:hypothetical protein
MRLLSLVRKVANILLCGCRRESGSCHDIRQDSPPEYIQQDLPQENNQPDSPEANTQPKSPRESLSPSSTKAVKGSPPLSPEQSSSQSVSSSLDTHRTSIPTTANESPLPATDKSTSSSYTRTDVQTWIQGVESAQQTGELEDPQLQDEVFRMGDTNKDLNEKLAIWQGMLKAQSVAIKGHYDELLTAKQSTSDLRVDNQYYATINPQSTTEWHRVTEETRRVIWHHLESIQRLEHENHRLSLSFLVSSRQRPVSRSAHPPSKRVSLPTEKMSEVGSLVNLEYSTRIHSSG